MRLSQNQGDHKGTYQTAAAPVRSIFACFTIKRSRREAATPFTKDGRIEAEKWWEKSGATAQQKRRTPAAAMRLTLAFLGSVNHQATMAETMRSVGTSDVHAVHDMSVWSIEAGWTVGRVLMDNGTWMAASVTKGWTAAYADGQVGSKGPNLDRIPRYRMEQ